MRKVKFRICLGQRRFEKEACGGQWSKPWNPGVGFEKINKEEEDIVWLSLSFWILMGFDVLPLPAKF